MHFVSSQSQSEQISEIVAYLIAHTRDSLELDEPTAAFADFESRL
jgi:hypothetical protein